VGGGGGGSEEGRTGGLERKGGEISEGRKESSYCLQGSEPRGHPMGSSDEEEPSMRASDLGSCTLQGEGWRDCQRRVLWGSKTMTGGVLEFHVGM